MASLPWLRRLESMVAKKVKVRMKVIRNSTPKPCGDVSEGFRIVDPS